MSREYLRLDQQNRTDTRPGHGPKPTRSPRDCHSLDCCKPQARHLAHHDSRYAQHFLLTSSLPATKPSAKQPPARPCLQRLQPPIRRPPLQVHEHQLQSLMDNKPRPQHSQLRTAALPKEPSEPRPATRYRLGRAGRAKPDIGPQSA
jgi:hypothetical protein